MPSIDGVLIDNLTVSVKEPTVNSILDLIDKLNPTVGLRKDAELDLLRLKDRGFKLYSPMYDTGKVTLSLVKNNVAPLKYIIWADCLRAYVVLDGTMVLLDTASFWKFVFK